MTSLRNRRWFRWMLVGSLLMSTLPQMSLPAFATVDVKWAKPNVDLANVFQTKPGPLSGRILYPDGGSPARSAVVRVWDCVKNGFVSVSNTDGRGRYSTSALREGTYFVIYGDRVYVPVQILPEAQLCSLDVIVPRGRVHFTPRQLMAAVKELASAEPSPKAAPDAAAADSAGAPGASAAGPAVAGPALAAPKLLPTLLIGAGVAAAAGAGLVATGVVGGKDERRPAPIVVTPTSPSSP